MDVYIWIITICATFALIDTQSCRREARCRVTKTHGMKGADCYNKDIENFTQCLPEDIEIIDLSRNRIRKLRKSDLAKYSHLKMLYLSDNIVMTIDDETFDGKDYLQTLDLSKNAFTKLPPVLFQLPSLQSLYLGQNLNINIVDAIEQARPIKSPLYHLDISYIMVDEPSELPHLGVMPHLQKYNVSGNKLIFPKPSDFAGLCVLKILDTANATVDFEKDCDCWTINKWLMSRKVQFKPFYCNVGERECIDDVPDEDLKIYEDCKKAVEEHEQQARTKTILLIVLPIIGVIAIAVMCYFYRRRRQRQRQQIKNNQELSLVPPGKR